MKCRKCEEAGAPSQVYHHGSTSTLMSCSMYYDEAGIPHNHDWNRVLTMYSCSNGHRWEQRHRNTCGCGWEQEIREFVFPEGSDGGVYYENGTTVTRLNGSDEMIPITHKLLTDDELIRWL